MDLSLKYGLNPHQHPARLTLPASSPLRVLNGTPGYVNIIDALGAWQLVREMKEATGAASATSFKHASPAGAAIAGNPGDTYLDSQFLSRRGLSPVASAYVRARGGDRMCSFGDCAAVSEVVDRSLAGVLKREVSDLIIAPGYDPDALEILRAKKGGGYLVLEIDPDYEPTKLEQRTLFGLQLEQPRNDAAITRNTFSNVVTGNRDLPDSILDTLVVATIALKYTQSNSMCVAYEGQVIGMGAGQQSRIHCTPGWPAKRPTNGFSSSIPGRWTSLFVKGSSAPRKRSSWTSTSSGTSSPKRKRPECWPTLTNGPYRSRQRNAGHISPALTGSACRRTP